MFSVGSWILLLLPFVFLGGWIYRWRRGIGKRNERVPATLSLLRPPGESLRQKIAELEEKLSEQVFMAAVIPIIGAVVKGVSKTQWWPFDVAMLTLSLGGVWFFGRRLIKTANELRAYRLGFHGERACGEQLNQLMLQGCRIFHDVPMAPYGNIDHVIVAPTGVYAVETKTRRMRKMTDNREDHVVLYDGATLRFPFGTSSRPIAQARQQANRLQTFLSSAVGESVTVRPILALPGWYVRRTSGSGIPVLNPKVVRREVLDPKKSKVSPQLLARVAHQLDQRCRDVAM